MEERGHCPSGAPSRKIHYAVNPRKNVNTIWSLGASRNELAVGGAGDDAQGHGRRAVSTQK